MNTSISEIPRMIVNVTAVPDPDERPGLFKLPQELYTQILAHLPCLYDIWALTLTCRHLNEYSEAHLYQHVILKDVKDHLSFSRALARKPEIALLVQNYAIEHEDPAATGKRQLWLPTLIQADTDSRVLSQFRNLKHLSLNVPIHNGKRKKQHPLAPLFVHPRTFGTLDKIVSCEIKFWSIDNMALSRTTWMNVMTDLFLHPTLEKLVLHDFDAAEIPDSWHMNWAPSFTERAKRNPTPLKELFVTLREVDPSTFATLLLAPKALQCLEISDASQWKDDNMRDIVLWVDAIRVQKDSLKRLSLRGDFNDLEEGPHNKKLILQDFIAVEYLAIGYSFIMPDSLMDATTGGDNRDLARPPNVETYEMYDHCGRLTSMAELASRLLLKDCVTLWPKFRELIMVYTRSSHARFSRDEPCRSYKALRVLPWIGGAPWTRGIPWNGGLSEVGGMPWVGGEGYPFMLKERSLRFEWFSSWGEREEIGRQDDMIYEAKTLGEFRFGKKEGRLLKLSEKDRSFDVEEWKKEYLTSLI